MVWLIEIVPPVFPRAAANSPTNSPGQHFLTPASNSIKRAKKGWKKGEEGKGKEEKRSEGGKGGDEISGGRGIIYRITRIVENCTASGGE